MLAAGVDERCGMRDGPPMSRLWCDNQVEREVGRELYKACGSGEIESLVTSSHTIEVARCWAGAGAGAGRTDHVSLAAQLIKLHLT